MHAYFVYVCVCVCALKGDFLYVACARFLCFVLSLCVYLYVRLAQGPGAFPVQAGMKISGSASESLCTQTKH